LLRSTCEREHAPEQITTAYWDETFRFEKPATPIFRKETGRVENDKRKLLRFTKINENAMHA
jgi:hypothetical protein